MKFSICVCVCVCVDKAKFFNLNRKSSSNYFVHKRKQEIQNKEIDCVICK